VATRGVLGRKIGLEVKSAATSAPQQREPFTKRIGNSQGGALVEPSSRNGHKNFPASSHGWPLALFCNKNYVSPLVS
jgi:hypothetical protein